MLNSAAAVNPAAPGDDAAALEQDEVAASDRTDANLPRVLAPTRS
jgi:hypothetical protein